MRKLEKAFLILIGIYSLSLMILLAEEQRLRFGESQGNSLLFIEAGLVIYGYIGYRLLKKNKIKEFFVSIWFTAGILFLFLGWFIHPSQVYIKAYDRIVYVKKFIMPETPDIASRRTIIELESLQLELQAAKNRLEKAPEYYKSSFLSLASWILAVLLFTNGVITLIRKGSMRIDKSSSYHLF